MGTEVSDGDTIDWFMLAADDSIELTVTNTGNRRITANSSTAVEIIDDDGTDQSGFFDLPTQPDLPIRSGDEAPFDLLHTSGLAGGQPFSIKLRVRLDDDDDDFVLTVTGLGQY